MQLFIPLAFHAPVGGVPIGILGKSLVPIKLESWGYQAVKTVLDYRLSRFDTIPACDGWTDRHVDGQTRPAYSYVVKKKKK